jgi:hypothetical protein
MSAPHAPHIVTLKERFELLTDWVGLAHLMKVPEDQHEGFICWLKYMVLVQWSWSRHAGEPPQNPTVKNADIAKTGRAFLRAIEQRGTSSTPSELAMAEEVRRFLRQVRPAKRGAARREDSDRFATFVLCMVAITYVFGGGVTCNRKARKGNIVDLLIELRPLLPPGLIPAGLLMSQIERLCAYGRFDITLPHVAHIVEQFRTPATISARVPAVVSV